MKKVTVKSLDGTILHSVLIHDPAEWITWVTEKNAFGEPGTYTVECEDFTTASKD